ncbi:hypothetical protein RGU72_00385 [Undibacterium sp. 5I1]|uniref:hypothetical protein n=1 Tax=unclassified Undibacterium TaxID=2630295 RepID=UPI002AB391AB|nr:MULTISPECIES: hypothetical protein [unclassified Undibacterium]MDY7536725.1 hypothetical protein [Undibacterium sp. 5I1]MEB0230230.1 hypothetical protein [Undibacterium sp. 10I3]MEB0257930.1 hypothetical protein [Undibacterium sp. 5I1]
MKTISEQPLRTFAILISTWVVFASSYLCYLHLARPWPYVLALAIIGIAWIARQLLPTGAAVGSAGQVNRRKITQAIVLAGSMLGLALLIPLGWTDGLVSQFAERSNSVMMGVIVVVFANSIPKQVSTARGLAMRRIAGWALVVGGLGYALSWLFLPLAYANIAAPLILFLGLMYALVRILGDRVLRSAGGC